MLAVTTYIMCFEKSGRILFSVQELQILLYNRDQAKVWDALCQYCRWHRKSLKSEIKGFLFSPIFVFCLPVTVRGWRMAVFSSSYIHCVTTIKEVHVLFFWPFFRWTSNSVWQNMERHELYDNIIIKPRIKCTTVQTINTNALYYVNSSVEEAAII